MCNNNVMSFALYFKQLRSSQGQKISTLARTAGVSRTTLYRWEMGQSLPGIPELEAVLAALNITPQERRRALDLLPVPRARPREQEELPVPLPHGGDLLRAMRLRRGWTQDYTAAMLGMAQPTLARWERGEAWPAEDLLERLSLLLRAQQAEREALRQSRFSLANWQEDSEAQVSLEVLEARSRSLQQQLLNPQSYLLGDLMYLSLEAKAVPLVGTSEKAQLFLAHLLLQHARFASERCQPPEAGRLAERAHQLLPRRGEQWNGLRLQSDMYRAVWRYPMVKHERVLRSWLDQPLDLSNRTWVMSQIGGSLMDQGRSEEGLELEQAAYHLAQEQGTPAVALGRRNSLAETYLLLGQPHQAVEMMTITDTMTLPMKVRAQLAIAEAHLDAGNRSLAHDWLGTVIQNTILLGIAYYQPQIDKLMSRM